MAINQEAYKELELIVGKRWISQDIAERECYRSIMAESSAHSGPYDGETPLPGAVILPGSTEEVSKVMKIANYYKIPVTPCGGLSGSQGGALSMAGNVGPAFGALGPTSNYGALAAPLKWFYMFTMLAGRLEIYTLLILVGRVCFRRQ